MQERLGHCGDRVMWGTHEKLNALSTIKLGHFILY